MIVVHNRDWTEKTQNCLTERMLKAAFQASLNLSRSAEVDEVILKFQNDPDSPASSFLFFLHVYSPQEVDTSTLNAWHIFEKSYPALCGI